MELDKKLKSKVIIAFVFIILGIALGAIGAHALEKVPGILPKHIESWKTGVLYQLFQGIGILILVLLTQFWKLEKTKLSINIVIIGTILFSCSIYLLTLNHSWNINALKYALIPITPLGGIMMIVGWGLFLVRVVRSNSFSI